MNRTVLFRRLSLAIATLSIAIASMAGGLEDSQLADARVMAADDAEVALQLQSWIDQRDIALLAQADGLITNDMRADAEQYAVAQLVEADGLVSAQLREHVEHQIVARIAAADGLVIESVMAMSLPESAPATRNPGAVMVAVKTAAGGR